jgi:hypothetical protein
MNGIDVAIKAMRAEANRLARMVRNPEIHPTVFEYGGVKALRRVAKRLGRMRRSSTTARQK